MRHPIYQVDAFTTKLFRGNPAAVVILEEWLPDEVLQQVAAENNLAETAFVIPGEPEFRLRWFSPEIEVQLCGHATLATAHVLFTHGYAAGSTVVFRYQGGTLSVERKGDLLVMDFPAIRAEAVEADPAVAEALRAAPAELHRAVNLLAVFESEADVSGLKPDFDGLGALDTFGVIVSAPGREHDFVSRFFAPGAGVPEDPVTGSAHCTLVPYWSRRLGKDSLHARQISRRGGDLLCEDRGDRVGIGGYAREYMRGEVHLD